MNSWKTPKQPAEATRPVLKGPRTFDHFPEDILCPVCGTNDDGQTVLVPIVGTQDGNIAQAAPTHLACAVCDHLSLDVRVMYRHLADGWIYPPNKKGQL